MSVATVRREGHRLLGRVLRRVSAGGWVRSSPQIANLGLIGDRATAAVVTTSGEICCYCPGRFDAPSLLGSLIDPDVDGTWRIELPRAEPVGRRYLEQSAVLETTLRHPAGSLVARYRRAALGLRQFVSRTCLSRDGIFVVRAGSGSVDISAALFPVWGYVPADDTMMRNSIAVLERQVGAGGGLLTRHLQKSRAQRREGALLVGT